MSGTDLRDRAPALRDLQEPREAPVVQDHLGAVAVQGLLEVGEDCRARLPGKAEVPTEPALTVEVEELLGLLEIALDPHLERLVVLRMPR